ncbi:PadR family transcriptional regulator, partial [Klebsiella oxytoca]
LKEECLASYDMAIDGRNRRYYRITERGRLQLNLYRGEWSSYSQKISRILEEAD